ncbi:2-phosphosulfolactate phosphatase [Paenibacillus sp. P46E]|uniref:2-phosphosulfolactate phosphatase n=1 Tax=Paenibacillus sp. P46E TaxID=1349436 RepID=UPI000A97967D|nr:2-phosphosulfolactate phosphatase [Paenibacillus sp. P46E]
MFYDQMDYEIKLEWGARGTRAASQRGDIVIIVDVLSFSSTVVTAVQHQAIIYPYPPPLNEQAKAYAQTKNAEMVWGRAEALREGGHSLSPLSFGAGDRARNYVMCSLNGALCTSAASQVPALLIGCLLNASAVAKSAQRFAQKLNRDITVITCGEKWSDAVNQENNLRPGIEDYLAAGAIIAQLQGSKSPEAEVCAGAYEYSRHKIERLIRESASARELRERGYDADVTYCCQLDKYAVVPMLHEEYFTEAEDR